MLVARAVRYLFRGRNWSTAESTMEAAQKHIAVPNLGLAVGNARAHSFLSRCTRCSACSVPETRVQLGPRTGSQRDSASAARETDREMPAPASRSSKVRAPVPAPK
jgi:hypothetical protein